MPNILGSIIVLPANVTARFDQLLTSAASLLVLDPYFAVTAPYAAFYHPLLHVARQSLIRSAATIFA